MNSSNAPSTAAVLITPGQEAAFRKRLELLNKKATKFGLSAIEVLEAEDRNYQIHTERINDGKELHTLVALSAGATAKTPVVLRRYRLKFPLIKLGDWQVVGKLEVCGAGNLTFCATHDGNDLQELLRQAEHPLHCQHCNAKRTRKEGFLLRSEGARYMQVGTSCLQDFTGIDPAAALFLAQMWLMVRDCEGELRDFEGAGRANAVETLGFLANVSFLSKTYGFVSAARAREEGIPATFDDAVALQFNLASDAELAQRYAASIEAHREHAKLVRAWALAKESESAFDRNLVLLLKQDCIALDRKHLAFAAAAVPMFAKSQEMAGKAQRPPSTHVGRVGEKLTLPLTLARIVTFETQYGLMSLVVVQDGQGNRLAWKTGSCPQVLRDAEAGFAFQASFKVKEHGHYQGEAQTAVTHLKLLELAQPA